MAAAAGAGVPSSFPVRCQVALPASAKQSNPAAWAHHADALPRVELRAALAYDDVAGAAALPAVQLHPQVLGVGVLVVLSAAALLLGRPARQAAGRGGCVLSAAAAAAGSGGLPTGASDGSHPIHHRAGLACAWGRLCELAAAHQRHCCHCTPAAVVAASAADVLAGPAAEGVRPTVRHSCAGQSLAAGTCAHLQPPSR